MVEAAVKEIIKDDLANLTDLLNKQDLRCEALEKACQDLSGKLEERSREALTLREDLERQQIATGAGDERIKALESFDIAALKERMNRLEDDADGVGGIQQVRVRVDSLENQLRNIQPSIDENSRLVSSTKSRTDEFELSLRKLSKQCEEFASEVQSFDERLTKTESLSTSVNVAQQALEDSVSKKYECLWQDVLHAIEEVRGGQLEALQNDVARQKEASRKETQSLVNYAMQFMASAHTERREMAIRKTLVTAWREQTWISARRRAGIAALHRLSLQRQRDSLHRWVRKAAVDHFVERLRDEYSAMIPDVGAIIQETGLAVKCGRLAEQVETLQIEMCPTARAEGLIKEQAAHVDAKMKVLGIIQNQLQEQESRLDGSDALHRTHQEQCAALDSREGETAQKLSGVAESLEDYAKAKEVQGMMRDVLLIWNSIKQLDVAKADKKDVDNFAIETSNRDKQSGRRLEDLQADFADKARQDTLRIQEKWSELDGRLDETSRNFRHWEQMWEKLSGFVEDLVTKISDLQAASDGKLPSAATTLRPSSRSRSRAEIPTLPVHGSTVAPTAGLDVDASRGGGSQAAVDSMDSKLLWINSAKGIVDATLDQAVSTTPVSSRSRPGRPKSASVRRPHDRGRIA
mmetsp:Transcript_48408/g.85268  ORF Transcript_48408/g.85268 Transcript_48408/m.85268 type:complete len:636 (-) Transcript_48408:162-2069(-)